MIYLKYLSVISFNAYAYFDYCVNVKSGDFLLYFIFPIVSTLNPRTFFEFRILLKINLIIQVIIFKSLQLDVYLLEML